MANKPTTMARLDRGGPILVSSKVLRSKSVEAIIVVGVKK